MVSPLVLPQPAAVGDEWGNSLNVAVHSVNADLEALKVRSIEAGLGLTGGGDLTENLSLAVDFAASGAVSDTKAVRADDTRLADPRTPLAHTHLWADTTDKPATFAPSAHTHPIADVVNLQATLDLTGANAGAANRLNRQSASIVGTAYNAMTDSGWYVMDSAAANAPVAATMFLEVRNYAGTYVEQIARHVVTGARYIRTMTASTWGAWRSESWQSIIGTFNMPNVPMTANYAKLRRVGDAVHINAMVTLTGSIGGPVLIDFPAGHLPASDMLYNEGHMVGRCRAIRSGVAWYTGDICPIFYAGVNRLGIYLDNGSGAQWTVGTPATFTTGDRMGVDFIYQAAPV